MNPSPFLKIALINLNDASRGYLPLGISYVAGALKEKDYDVRLYDKSLTPPEEIIRQIREFPPDVIGISFLSINVKKAKEISLLLKGTKAVIVAGGPHATAMPEDVLSDSGFDFVVRGEGEHVFTELCEVVEKEGRVHEKEGRVHFFQEKLSSKMNPSPFSSVAGVAYRDDNGRIRFTEDRPPVQDLDSLPQIPWELLPIKHYIRHFAANPSFGYRGVPIMASRGCPYNCIFCQPVHGKATRYRSVENVIEEMAGLKKAYGLRGFNFCDDTLTINKDWALELCRQITFNKELKNIIWSCNGRVDRVDGELLNEMAQAGCRTIWYGIESGCEESLRQMRKGTMLTQAQDACMRTKKAGIGIRVNVLIGFPWEDETMIYETIRFAKALRPDQIQFSCVLPWPGTQLYQQARDLFHVTDFDYTRRTVMPTRHLSIQELERIRRVCLRRLYLDPRYVARSIISLRSPRQLIGYFQRFRDKILTGGSAV